MIGQRLFCFFILISILFGCASKPPPELHDDIKAISEEEAPTPEEAPPESEQPRSRRGSQTKPKFDWPVDEARMTRGFFFRNPKKKRSKRPHLGIDLAAPKNTPIYAAHDGVVIYVGREFKGFGRMIMIEGDDQIASLYAHLGKARVKEGQKVKQGDLIGDMGRSGRATGVHLHFEIRTKNGPVDPLLYLPKSK